MKILFCGLGSIGKKHAALLQRHFPGYDLFALRTYQGQEKNDLNIQELRSWSEVDLHTFGVAFITNPTSLHLQYALECASRKMNLFIEKPVDQSLSGLEDLLSLVDRHRLTTYVAYPLRFHPVTRELKSILHHQHFLHSRAVCASYLPSWRPNQDHKKSYSSHQKQGGGVLLDLSHDIDLIAYLYGEILEIEGFAGRQSTVTVDSEDYADLLITHPLGKTNLHLDYFCIEPRREIEITTQSSFIKADLIHNTLQINDGKESQLKKFPFEREDMYRDQLSYFFRNIENRKMENNLFSAADLYKKLITFRENQCLS